MNWPCPWWQENGTILSPGTLWDRRCSQMWTRLDQRWFRAHRFLTNFTINDLVLFIFPQSITRKLCIDCGAGSAGGVPCSTITFPHGFLVIHWWETQSATSASVSETESICGDCFSVLSSRLLTDFYQPDWQTWQTNKQKHWKARPPCWFQVLFIFWKCGGDLTSGSRKKEMMENDSVVR